MDRRGYGWAVAIVAACTAIAALMFPYFAIANVVMIYILGVVLAATRWGRGPSLLVAILGGAAFDFFFVPPYLTFEIHGSEYLVTFAVMLVLAIVTGTLTAAVRERSEVARQRDQERLRSTILATVSHDLRTPLAVVTGAASSLVTSGDRLNEAAKRELILTIHEEVQRMNRLANNVLEMGRLDAGGATLAREWQPLEEVFGSALREVEVQLDGREVVLGVPDDLPLVPIDEVLIERVLVNLLENALRYAPAGSPIELRARAGRGEVTVEVLDRGPGIAPGEEDLIFDRYFRSERTKARGGMGLGLAIARSIVDAHGGTLRAANRDGGGAILSFSLPLRGVPEPSP